MPGISADSTEAALVEWSVSPGAKVSRGDVIASVETDKAVVELEAEEDGVLLLTFASAGDTVAIGGPIAVFIQPGEEALGEEAILISLGLGPQAGPLESPDENRSQDLLVPGATAEIEPTTEHARIFASPIARRLATAAGLRLEDLQGSGPGGRIGRRDVELAISQQELLPGATVAAVASPVANAQPSAARQPPAPVTALPGPASAGFTDVPHSKFRRAVAAALTASKQQVPHFYLKATCAVDSLLELRARVNADVGAKITINDFFVKAAARAMIDRPDMNVGWTPDAVRHFDTVDIAVAMSSERGLVTPVVRSVQSRSLSDISASIKDFSVRAGDGRLKQHELEGGSLTISNLGMFGVEEFAAIINPPQVAILAVGAVTGRPVEREDGGVEFAKFVTVVLSVDHRPVDGAVAAQWLKRFNELIENPYQLLV